MQPADLPSNEAERLRSLRDYNVLDTLPEQAYDDIAYIASQICDTPIALVSLVDEERQWFKAKVGLDANETGRDVAFCAHALLQPNELFVVEDASADRRFADNPLVTEDPSIRFYAGAPLVTSEGTALGTLCVIDREPRQLTEQQSKTLAALARQVMAQLQLRQTVDMLGDTSAALEDANHLLAKSNNDLENFAHVAAHDLKEPLRMISSFTDLLTDSLAGKLDEDEQAYFAHVVDGAKRGKELTEALLQYAKLVPHAENYEFIGLCDAIETSGKAAMMAYPNGQVVWDTCTTRIYSDPQLLEHLLSNLITNGLKYNKQAKPTVNVKVIESPSQIEICVHDNGIGIEPSIQGKVFDMFARGHGRSEYEGTGIGLAVCRRIMELHGGVIILDSQCGQGSKFTCVFPTSSVVEESYGTHQHSFG
jgi:signal transduction histidine kinase